MRVFNRSFLRVAAAGLLVLAVAAVGTAACGDDDSATNGDVAAQLTSIQESLDSLHDELVHNGVYSAVQAMRAQDIHHLNLDVQELSSLDDISDYQTRLMRVSEAVAVTDWPDDLQGAADDLAGHLDAADEAIDNDDLAGTKTAVKDVHDFWHILDADAATFLGGSADHSGHSDDGGEHSGDEAEHRDDESMDDMDHSEDEGDSGS